MMALVDRLDQRGLLVRAPSRRDRRRQELTLSADGTTLLEAARRRIAEHESRFIGRLGPEAAGTLLRLLPRVYA
jgi:DNA-binding MarR family transcriptional regulator